MAKKGQKRTENEAVVHPSRLANWALVDNLRQGLYKSDKVKPGERLLIRDAVDGFFGDGKPTGHLLATDGGCFGNNFGLFRIIAYVPWFEFKEGYVLKIFTDAENWETIVKELPAATDVVNNLYGIKFDFHCIRNIFETRIVDNPSVKDLTSREDKEGGFWASMRGLLKRPEEPYLGIKFAIIYTQGFRGRHKDKPEEELAMAKEECRILVRQMAGWKGFRLLIEDQGVKLLGAIEAELQKSKQVNSKASKSLEGLENKAAKLLEEKQEIYKEAYEQTKGLKGMGREDRVRLTKTDDMDVYKFTPIQKSRLTEIEQEIARIRTDIQPHAHLKGSTESRIVDLNCKAAIIRYAVEFFA